MALKTRKQIVMGVKTSNGWRPLTRDELAAYQAAQPAALINNMSSARVRRLLRLHQLKKERGWI